jgi:hypothetical protein
MSKYISIFFLGIGISIVLFFIFGSLIAGGDPAEFAAITFGCINIILISFVIALLYYVSDLLKKLK